MNFYTQIDAFITDTCGVSLANFGGELALCVTIVLILLTRMFTENSPCAKKILLAVAVVGFLTALALQWSMMKKTSPEQIGRASCRERV